jgi:hypothetical protein
MNEAISQKLTQNLVDTRIIYTVRRYVEEVKEVHIHKNSKDFIVFYVKHKGKTVFPDAYVLNKHPEARVHFSDEVIDYVKKQLFRLNKW